MAENSPIQWTDHTFNPWRGCTMVSPGCANCYAAREAVRFPGIRGVWGDSGTRIVAVPSAWKEPMKWNRRAGFQRERHRVFCASLADVFEDWKGDLRFPADIAPDGWVTAMWDGNMMVREFEESARQQGLVPATMDNARSELFHLIERTKYLDWLLLTKRPENVMRMVPDHWREEFPANVWMGTTTENQDMANKRIPELLKIPARVRFLSCEPLVGPVDLGEALDHPLGGISVNDGIHWVICGGESGPKARPMSPHWARFLKLECELGEIPFFFKQWGEWAPGSNFPDGIPSGESCDFEGELKGDDEAVWKVGKKAAGTLLDGVAYLNFPTKHP